MNWTIVRFVVYALGSVFFLAGLAIGIAMQMGWIE